MISQLTGAFMRAILVALLVATPSLLLPGLGQEITQIVALLAIFAAFFVFVEYAATYPGLVEFRDAPPYNRVRFLMLLATLFLITVACRGQYDPTPLAEFVTAIGLLLGHSVDFPYSPLSIVMDALPRGTTVEQAQMVQIAAGLAYLVALVSLTVFAILIRLRSWPSPTGSFNVWINLPLFDPTAGGDVVHRLKRDAGLNIVLGILLSFLIPAIVKAASSFIDPISMQNPQTLIWTMTAWAFLPASMIMRGIAMGRIAELIEEKRNRAYSEAEKSGLQTASA